MTELRMKRLKRVHAFEKLKSTGINKKRTVTYLALPLPPSPLSLRVNTKGDGRVMIRQHACQSHLLLIKKNSICYDSYKEVGGAAQVQNMRGIGRGSYLELPEPHVTKQLTVNHEQVNV